MYADRKEWDVGDLEVDVDYELDPKATSRFDVVLQSAAPVRRAGGEAAGDRGQVPGAPRADGRGRDQGQGRACLSADATPPLPRSASSRPTSMPTAREALGRLGPLAEELGYDSLWMGEHVVVPDPHVPPSPMQPLDPILDPLVALGFVAARTERIRLATGIIILPQRNPLVLAKQLASLDSVSGGRLVFGMGVGYLEPEMTAIGVPMERRGTRAVEYLEAMRALWEQEQPSFEGEFVRFSGVNAHPRPVQSPAARRDGRPQRRGASARGAPRERVVRVLPRPGCDLRAARRA